MKTGTLNLVLGLIILFAAADGLRADPLSQWNWRFPYPQGCTLAAVTYGGGQFVAVGDNGTIITSPDGYNWTSQTFGVFPYLRGVAYADGQYAAVGDGGVILVSSNAVTWTQVSSVTTNSLRGIAGNPSGSPRFLAVGDSGTAVSTVGSTTWVNQNTGNTNNLRAVIYNAGSFVCVGDNGTVLQYATSWSTRRNPGTTNYLQAAAFGNSQYVFGGSFQVYTLEYGYPYLTAAGATIVDTGNLLSYSIVSPGYAWDGGLGNGAYTISGLALGNGIFVGVGYTAFTLEYNYPGIVMTSTDGTNWAGLPYHASENSLYSVTYGNGSFVAVGDAGGIIISTDGTNWTEVSGYHRSAIIAIACNTNLCIASALPIAREGAGFADFTTLVSTNGLNWSVSTANLPTMVDLAGGGAQIVGVRGNVIYTTTDGYNWLSNDSPTNNLQGVRYTNGHFTAVGDDGAIYTSADGTNWNNDSITTSGSFSGVAFGNGLYVVDGSVSATSMDGISWSLCSSNPPATITRIVYGEGLFVAAAYIGSFDYPSGEILTSTDGMNWQVQFSDPSGSFTGLAYSGGTFLAVSAAYGSQSGAMFKSSDGTNWVKTAYNLPLVDGNTFSTYYNLNWLSLSYLGDYATACAYGGTFLAGGLDGILVQSGNTWNPALINSPQATSNGFAFSYNQQIDVPYHIQASTNLVSWENIYSGTGSGQFTNYIYAAATNYPARFFRIVSP